MPLNQLDLYNMSSDLYNDICYTLTSENGTDKPLKDRQNEFIKNNMSICEEDCDFTQYDNETKKATCSCFTKVTLPLISEIKVDKQKLFDNFKDIRNIANFKMLTCIHLLLDKKNIFKNSANYILILLLILSIVSVFIFCFHNNRKIQDFSINFFIQKNSNNIINISKNNNIKEIIKNKRKREKKYKKNKTKKEKNILKFRQNESKEKKIKKAN